MPRNTLLALVMAAVVVGVIVSGQSARAAGWSTNWQDYAKKDEKDKENPLVKKIDELTAALDALEKEDAELQKAVSEAASKSSQDAGGEVERQRRLYATALAGILPRMELLDQKYGRAAVAAIQIQQDKAMKEDLKPRIEILATRIRASKRANIERTGDLYADIDKDRKALSIFEVILKSIPEDKRAMEMELKAKIDTLKEKINPKRPPAK